jgi:hypothetical protein
MMKTRVVFIARSVRQARAGRGRRNLARHKSTACLLGVNGRDPFP